jgi:hypothetical protein
LHRKVRGRIGRNNGLSHGAERAPVGRRSDALLGHTTLRGKYSPRAPVMPGGGSQSEGHRTTSPAGDARLVPSPCDHAGLEPSRRFGRRSVAADDRLGVYLFRGYYRAPPTLPLTPYGPGCCVWSGPHVATGITASPMRPVEPQARRHRATSPRGLREPFFVPRAQPGSSNGKGHPKVVSLLKNAAFFLGGTRSR